MSIVLQGAAWYLILFSYMYSLRVRLGITAHLVSPLGRRTIHAVHLLSYYYKLLSQLEHREFTAVSLSLT